MKGMLVCDISFPNPSNSSPRIGVTPSSWLQGSGTTGGSLQINRWKLKTSRELPIILEESIEHTPSNEIKQTQKISTCNWLELEPLGS